MVFQQFARIRDLIPSDMQAILEIEYRCFKDPYPLSLLNQLYRTSPDGFLVAERDGKLVGYVIGTMRFGSIGHILAIAVDPPYRRQNVGSALMASMLGRLRAKGAKEVRLEVRKSNVGARQFYRNIGFVEREEIPYYYEDGEEAVVMEYKYSDF